MSGPGCCSLVLVRGRSGSLAEKRPCFRGTYVRHVSILNQGVSENAVVESLQQVLTVLNGTISTWLHVFSRRALVPLSTQTLILMRRERPSPDRAKASPPFPLPRAPRSPAGSPSTENRSLVSAGVCSPRNRKRPVAAPSWLALMLLLLLLILLLLLTLLLLLL